MMESSRYLYSAVTALVNHPSRNKTTAAARLRYEVVPKGLDRTKVGPRTDRGRAIAISRLYVVVVVVVVVAVLTFTLRYNAVCGHRIGSKTSRVKDHFRRKTNNTRYPSPQSQKVTSGNSC